MPIWGVLPTARAYDCPYLIAELVDKRLILSSKRCSSSVIHLRRLRFHSLWFIMTRFLHLGHVVRPVLLSVRNICLHFGQRTSAANTTHAHRLGRNEW